MSRVKFPSQRVRTIFDCLLIILLLLIAIANYLPAVASSKSGPRISEAALSEPAAQSNSDPASAQLAPNRALLDDVTNAATIAAENAALTLSQYFTIMPIVTR